MARRLDSAGRQAPAGRKARPSNRPIAKSTVAPKLAPTGDIIAQLRSLLPSLAPAEQRVCEVVKSDPGRTAHLTITELAAEAETSETTVVRFCRSIGVGSYPALRLMVANWAGRNEGQERPALSPEINPDDDLASMVARVGQSLTTAVRETVERLDIEALDIATKTIVEARRIDIYGVGASGLVAEDLQSKLYRIGLSAWAWTGPHLALTSAANLGPDDVVVAVSNSGRTIDTYEPVLTAKRAGACVIAITNFIQSPIADEADIVLTTVSDETPFRSGAMASRIAALTVVDSLFVGVARRQWTAATDAIVRTNRALAGRRKVQGRGRDTGAEEI